MNDSIDVLIIEDKSYMREVLEMYCQEEQLYYRSFSNLEEAKTFIDSTEKLPPAYIVDWNYNNTSTNIHPLHIYHAVKERRPDMMFRFCTDVKPKGVSDEEFLAKGPNFVNDLVQFLSEIKNQ